MGKERCSTCLEIIYTFFYHWPSFLSYFHELEKQVSKSEDGVTYPCSLGPSGLGSTEVVGSPSYIYVGIPGQTESMH